MYIRGCTTTTMPCHVQAWRRLGDRCVVQIPPILRHLRPVENIIFLPACLTDWLGLSATSISRQTTHLTPASNTPRLVTICLSLAACLGLWLAFSRQPFQQFRLLQRQRQVSHHKDAETTSTSQQLDGTWASLNRPDIGSKSRKGPPLWSLGWSPFLERLPALPKTL